jgi:hypothetical protein
MLTSTGRISSHDILFPGSGVFVLVVLLLIAAIFVRVYVMGSQSGRTIRRSERQKVHRAGRVPERGGNHGRRTVSRRRPNRH